MAMPDHSLDTPPKPPVREVKSVGNLGSNINPTKKGPSWSWIFSGLVVVVLLALGTVFTSDLGARLIKKNSPRLSVRRGEQVTLQLASSDQVRKLEICAESNSLFLGSFTGECQTLKYFVPANAVMADVVIPNSFPLKRAVVITRLRDDQGNLIPVQPGNERIALWIREAAPAKLSASTGSDGGSSGGGSGNGGGGSGNDNNSTSSSSGSARQVITPLPEVITGMADFFDPPTDSQTVQGEVITMGVELYYAENVEVENCRILIDGEIAPDSRTGSANFPTNACNNQPPYGSSNP